MSSRRSLAFVCVLALGVAGCQSGVSSPTASSSSSEPSAPAASGGTVAAAPSVAQAEPCTMPDVQLPEPEVKKIVIGVSAAQTYDYFLQYAKTLGLYEKVGFTDVDVKFIDSATLTAQGMQSGNIHFGMNAASQDVLSLKTGVPSVAVGVTLNELPYYFFVTSDIKSGDDLRGKRVATSQFGGQSYAADVLSLKSLGLSVSDVEIVNLQSQSARVAALKSGSVQAAPADPQFAEDLATSGITPLVKLPESGQLFAGTSVDVQRSFAKENPNTVLAVLAAGLVAIQCEYADKDRLVKAYAEWSQTSEEDAAHAWQIWFDSGLDVRNLMSSDEAFEAIPPVLEPIAPGITDVDPTEAWDPSFLEKLEQMGFMEAAGVPNS